MPDAFDQAALRHFVDALELAKGGRNANADHLVGFAAECALKTALHTAGGLRDHHRVHIETLWDRISLHGIQRRYPALAALLKKPNPFVDWTASQRYAADGAIGDIPYSAHAAEARRLMGAVHLLGVHR